MARHICTIEIDPQIRRTRLDGFTGFQTKRLISDGTKKTMKLSITQLRRPKLKINAHTIPLINTHNPGVTSIFRTIKANLSMLLQSSKMKNQFGKKKKLLRNRRRQSKNLRKHITRTKVTLEKESEFTVKEFGASRYGTYSNNSKCLGSDYHKWRFSFKIKTGTGVAV